MNVLRCAIDEFERHEDLGVAGHLSDPSFGELREAIHEQRTTCDKLNNRLLLFVRSHKQVTFVGYTNSLCMRSHKLVTSDLLPVISQITSDVLSVRSERHGTSDLLSVRWQRYTRTTHQHRHARMPGCPLVCLLFVVDATMHNVTHCCAVWNSVPCTGSTAPALYHYMHLTTGMFKEPQGQNI